MKIDGGLGGPLLDIPGRAAELEGFGYDGLFTFEGPHDPFFPLLLAAEHTERVELVTAIAVAFARNPMLLANIGYDLQEASAGRFVLGLGSQIKPHIEKRFSMPWSQPAARMRELILAVRAIWHCWQEGTRLDFRGDFYTHTLMTPFFDPGPNAHGTARIALAGVGPTMTRVAGEVADWFLVHPLSTERYLREHTLPALEEGLAAAGRTRADLVVSWPLFVVTGNDEAEMAEAERTTKQQMAFYGSTPAYRPVLETHGWGELQDELNRMSKEGRWEEMADVVDDEILRTFAVVGEPDRIAGIIRERYTGLVDRISPNAPYRPFDAAWIEMLGSLRAAAS